MSRLRRDETMSFLVRGSIASLSTRVVGVGLSYVAAVILSRALGANGYGFYSIGLAWVLILVLPSRAGLDFAALRFGAIYLDQGKKAQLRGLVRLSAAGIFLFSVLTGAIIYGLTSAGLTSAPRELAPGMALVILPLAMLALIGAFLRNARLIVASQFYEQVLRPAVLILCLLATLVAGAWLSAANAMMLTGASAFLAMLLGSVHAVRAAAAGRGDADYSSWPEWLALSLPMFLTTIVQEVLNQLDIIMLGYLDRADAAGLYSAAWRLASLVTFGLAALATVNGPLIAAAHARGDSEELARVARTTARLGFAASLALAAALAVGGQLVLRLFGPEFVRAYPALLILLAGGLTNAFTGAVAYLLTMTGRQVQALVIFIGALVVSFWVNLLLIPRLSIVGAAIASSTATIVWNVAMLVVVRRRLGIDASALARAPLAGS